jgi:hypothetical protein
LPVLFAAYVGIFWTFIGGYYVLVEIPRLLLSKRLSKKQLLMMGAELAEEVVEEIAGGALDGVAETTAGEIAVDVLECAAVAVEIAIEEVRNNGDEQ